MKIIGYVVKCNDQWVRHDPYGREEYYLSKYSTVEDAHIFSVNELEMIKNKDIHFYDSYEREVYPIYAGLPMNQEELKDLFKSEISDHASEIDPDNEQDWYSMTLGWATAKGLSPEEAWEFSTYIRYHTDLG